MEIRDRRADVRRQDEDRRANRCFDHHTSCRRGGAQCTVSACQWVMLQGFDGLICALEVVVTTIRVRRRRVHEDQEFPGEVVSDGQVTEAGGRDGEVGGGSCSRIAAGRGVR